MKKNSFFPAAIGTGLAAGAAFLFHKRGNVELSAPRSGGPELAGRMAEFLRDDRFRLAVQPVIELDNGGIIGGEVLCRLDHPERGSISPDEFLPSIKEAGLSSRFDYRIFERTCALMGELSRQGRALQYLSCNFSRLTLSEKGTAARLVRIADGYGVARDRVAVEVTERERETDTGQFCENLRQLKEAGFRIFVDDVGAGVTSVRDLWSYPVDVVKIDRSLLLAAENEPGRTAYRRLRDLAVGLGCKVLCEGVETEAQHRFAVDAGCHYGQGFLFHRPMEAGHFVRLMGGTAPESAR